MDRPLKLVPEPRGVPVEELEAGAMRDLMEVAAKWAVELPTSSEWRDACVSMQRACALSLRSRRLLLRQSGRRIG